MSELKPEQNISVEIVSGIEGLCLLVNDYRVAGPKPWGGGTVTQLFKTKLVDIERAIYGNRRTQPENDCPAHYDKSGCAMNSGFCIGGECSSYADAGMPENEPLTNAQRIRGMSDEELARNNVRKRRGHVIWSTSDGREFSSYLFGGTYRPDEETIALAVQHELDWLQQPAETEGKE